MSVRGWIVDRLRTDPSIGADIPSGQIYSAGAVNMPESPDMIPPFVVVRELPSLPGLGGADRHVIQRNWWIMVHDAQGSYALISRVLKTARDLLWVRDPTDVGDEWMLSSVWIGDGGDLFDDGFNTAVNYGSFTTISRKKV